MNVFKIPSGRILERLSRYLLNSILEKFTNICVTNLSEDLRAFSGETPNIYRTKKKILKTCLHETCFLISFSIFKK
jgi:hypothetical protein